MLRAGFLNLRTVDVLGQIILCSGACPVPCRAFSCIPGLYPLRARSTPQSGQPKVSPHTAEGLFWEVEPPLVENH